MVDSYNYFGHCITDDLSDDEGIHIQRITLFVQGNVILRKFNSGMASSLGPSP